MSHEKEGRQGQGTCGVEVGTTGRDWVSLVIVPTERETRPNPNRSPLRVLLQSLCPSSGLITLQSHLYGSKKRESSLSRRAYRRSSLVSGVDGGSVSSE